MSYGPLAKRWGWGGGVLPFYRFTGKMAKHVCSCHGTQCFQSEQREQWRGSGRKERGREGEVKLWSLVATCRRCCSALGYRRLFVLNIDTEAENKPCPNTGAGWWTGEDGPQTRLSPATSSFHIPVQVFSPSRAKLRP